MSITLVNCESIIQLSLDSVIHKIVHTSINHQMPSSNCQLGKISYFFLLHKNGIYRVIHFVLYFSGELEQTTVLLDACSTASLQKEDQQEMLQAAGHVTPALSSLLSTQPDTPFSHLLKNNSPSAKRSLSAKEKKSAMKHVVVGLTEKALVP